MLFIILPPFRHFVLFRFLLRPLIFSLFISHDYFSSASSFCSSDPSFISSSLSSLFSWASFSSYPFSPYFRSSCYTHPLFSFHSSPPFLFFLWFFPSSSILTLFYFSLFSTRPHLTFMRSPRTLSLANLGYVYFFLYIFQTQSIKPRIKL